MRAPSRAIARVLEKVAGVFLIGFGIAGHFPNNTNGPHMAKIFALPTKGRWARPPPPSTWPGLAKIGQRVLMVDLDPQGNATMGSGVDKRKLDLTVYDVLLESARSKRHGAVGQMWLLGAGRQPRTGRAPRWNW